MCRGWRGGSVVEKPKNVGAKALGFMMIEDDPGMLMKTKGQNKKMSKMKVDPDELLKTKERMTICPAQNARFSARIPAFSQGLGQGAEGIESKFRG